MHSGAARNAASRGTSLVELLVALAIMACLAAVGVPRLAAQLDRLGARGATDDIVRAIAVARRTAAGQADYASVIIDETRGVVRVRCAGIVPWERDLAQRYGVRVVASRDSIAFAPSGLGWGAANTTIIVSRGGSVDTIVTSRLGRVRRS